MKDDFEYSREDDIFYNYCLWKYAPRLSVTGKFRPVNLLRHSFEVVLEADHSGDGFIGALRRGVGMGNTVWGLKLTADGEISWEYYFYDYRRRERERSLSRVLMSISPWVLTKIVPNENLHYFMFSLDMTAELIQEGGDLDLVHLYIGNPGSAVSSGICYALTEKETRLENFYFFFHPEDQMEDIVAKIACSAQIDTSLVHLDEILWPELKDCATICCANKQQYDCIYFSGITVDQFIFFLGRMKYPDRIVSFVEKHRNRLDHLLFDVGFDYRLDNKELVIPKSGYYGTF